MGIYTLQEYRAVNQKRIENIKKAGIKSQDEAAKFLAARARQLCPKKSGYLMSNIKRVRNKVTVRGTDQETKFPYLHWINQTPGMEQYHVLYYSRGAWLSPGKSVTGRWKMIAPPGTAAIYGQSPNWNWTGSAGFFKKAIFESRGKFLSITSRALRRSLEATA